MLVTERDIETKGTLGGRVIAATLDQDSLPHLMSLLTDTYSDKGGAAIRETITNAIDSHIAAGQDKPVMISTPTRLSPNFVVRDFGVGMDVDDIVNVVSKYGASTKRNTNTQAGMLGIGFKAPLTFTEQFTIEGVKNGKRMLAVMSRTLTGAASIEIVSESDTTDPNGVTIKIPVNDNMGDFIKKVEDFCRYIEPGKVFVNGKPVENGWTKIADHIYIGKYVYSWGVPSQYDVMVMGNVSYPLTKNHENFMRGHTVIYYAPMGSLDFTPSREDLEFSRRTIESLKDFREDIAVNLSKYLQDEIANQPTYNKAYARKFQLQVEHGVVLSDISWRGRDIPNGQFSLRYADWPDNLDNREEFVSSRELTVANIDNLPDDRVYVKNFNCKNFTRIHARKLRAYYEDDDMQRVIFVPDDSIQYLDAFDIDDWEVIRKTRIAPIQKGVKRVRRWPGFDGQSYMEQLVAIDTSKPIYYASKSEASEYRLREIKEQALWVTDSQKDKFLEKYPTARHYTKYWEDRATELRNGFTPDEIKALGYSQGHTALNGLDSTKLDDPRLQYACDAANGVSSDLSNRYSNYQNAYRYTEYAYRRANPAIELNHEQGTIEALYPLLIGYRYNSINAKHRDHVVDYLNWHYNNNLKDQK